MNQPSLFDMPTRTLPQSTIGTMTQWLLDCEDAIVIDTETTGLTSEDEVIQIAIVNMAGQVLLDTLVRPVKAQVHPQAYEVHKISQRSLFGATLFKSINLASYLENKYVIGYNVGFDARLLAQSARANQDTALYNFLYAPTWKNLAQKPQKNKAHWLDIMDSYTDHWGEPYKKGGHKKQTLANACAQQGVKVGWKHQALDDARLTLELIRALAQDQTRRFK